MDFLACYCGFVNEGYGSMKRVSLLKGVVLGTLVVATATALTVVSAPATATPATTIQTARVSQ